MKRSLKFLAVSMGFAAWTNVASAQNVVKIGEIEAQTGSLNTYGWMSSQGMRMAVDEINKAGGFQVAGKTYTLELINPDTQGNPQQALIQLKKLLEEDKVKYVFGPFLTNVFKGIEGYAKQHDGQFLLMGGATQIHYELGKPGNDYLMRTWNWDAGPSGFGTLMVEYLRTERREEGGDADAERRVRPRRRRHLPGSIQGSGNRIPGELVRARYQGLLGGTRKDQCRQARLPVPRVHRRRVV